MERRLNTASQQTKQALAAALKELMAQKPIENITIHDLTEHCGIRRQTFYYHFEDVYDLLRWMFQVFRYIEENRAVCLCALKSVGRKELKRFFEADIHAIIYRTVEQLGNEVGAIQAGVTKDDVDLLTHFYVLACVGLLESWLLGEIDRTPEELIAFLDRILKEHICGARFCWSKAVPEHSAE